MKNLTPAFQAFLASPAMTPAWAWIIKRTDGVFLGFTTHVADQYVDTGLPGAPTPIGHVFPAILCRATPGIDATDIATTDSLAQSNLDITSGLGSMGLSEDDLRAGLYQGAQVEINLYNYNDLSIGVDTVFSGTLGGSTGGDLSVKLEQRGLSQPLEQMMDDLTGPMCRVALGSARCGVDLAPYRRTGTIASPQADRIFTDTARTEPDDWWTKGKITITSAATGRVTVVDVKHSLATGQIELVEEVYFGLAAGDTYSITPGCNKLLKAPDPTGATSGTYTGDCKVKFNNVIRFVGEPEVPGQIAIQEYAGQAYE